MTTPTTQNTVNTVFSQATEVAVKADVEVVVVTEKHVRCDEGAILLHEWRLAYEAEKDFAKAHDILWKFEPYFSHLKGCEQCQDYEKRRWHP